MHARRSVYALSGKLTRAKSPPIKWVMTCRPHHALPVPTKGLQPRKVASPRCELREIHAQKGVSCATRGQAYLTARPVSFDLFVVLTQNTPNYFLKIIQLFNFPKTQSVVLLVETGRPLEPSKTSAAAFASVHNATKDDDRNLKPTPTHTSTFLLHCLGTQTPNFRPVRSTPASKGRPSPIENPVGLPATLRASLPLQRPHRPKWQRRS